MQLSLLVFIPLVTAFSLPWLHGKDYPSRPPFHWRHKTTPGSQLSDDENGPNNEPATGEYRLSTPFALLEGATGQAGQTTASSGDQGSASVPDSDQDGVTGEFAAQRYSNRPIPTLKHPTLSPHVLLRFSRPPRHSLPPLHHMRTMGYGCFDGSNCNTNGPDGEGQRVTPISKEGSHAQDGQAEGQIGTSTVGSKLEEATSEQDRSTEDSVTGEFKKNRVIDGQDSSIQNSVTGGQTEEFKYVKITPGQDYVIGGQTGAPTEGSKLEEVFGGQDSSTQQKDVSQSDDSTQSQEGASQSLDAVSQPAESVTIAN